MPKPIPIPLPPTESKTPETTEQETVHEIYEKIAPHFAQTRFKPWPLIDTFLKSQPSNSIGLDSGAGNGKYLPVATAAGSSLIALDRSLGLLEHAKMQSGSGMGGSQGAECIRGDLGCRAWRDGVFDFAISIAAIHHLSTPIRRRQAVQALLSSLRLSTAPPYARFMFYVWAFEQGSNSRRKMGTTATSDSTILSSTSDEQSDRINGSIGKEEHAERIQDVLVPWVLPTIPKRDETFKKAMPTKSSKKIRKPGDRVSPKVDISSEEVDKSSEPPIQQQPEVLHRYYHLFVEGELKELVESAGEEEGYRIVRNGESEGDGIGGKWLRIKDVGWEADNWWLEGEVGIVPDA